MVGAIRSNFGLKALSLALAVLGWAYFRFASNPFVSSRFDQQLSVPITSTNLGSGYIARYTERTAIVTIQSKSGEPAMKADEIKAVLDLTNRGAGVYNVPIQLVAPNVEVQSLSPASVTLSIERIDQRELPVAVHYAGEGNVVVSKFTITPSSVTASGPTSDLSQVASIRVDLPLGNTTGPFNEMVRPIAVDSTGNEIRDVQVAPNLVRVQALFTKAVH